MIDALPYIRLAVALSLMSIAAISDWKTRRASNWLWMVMGGIGMVLMFYELLIIQGEVGSTQLTVDGSVISGGNVLSSGIFLIFIPIGIFFFDVFWDREPVYHEGKFNILPIILYAFGFLAMALMIYYEGFSEFTMALLSVPIMIIVFIIFYYARLIHGGADAKAFMALAILFPHYPVFEGLPLIQGPEYIGMNIAFPFAFLILMNAAIIQVAVVPLGMFIKNLKNKDFGFPEMLLGYRMDLEDVPHKFVWPMQKVMDGEMVLVLFPKRGGDIQEDLKPLREMGEERIWVTPKVPFIIPMLLGIIFSVVVGNLVMLFF